MARDYKYRTENRGLHRRGHLAGRSRDSLALWKWMLITSLIIGLVVFLFYLGTRGGKTEASQAASPAVQNTAKDKNPPEKRADAGSANQTAVKTEPENPQFEFYTILTGKEVVVPDHEIDTRSREERVGQVRAVQYHLQAGSYKDFNEADQLRAKLALMGIESRIEKAKVGNVTWHRIKMGPFTRMKSVDVIRSRLKADGIDSIVIEEGG